MRITIEARDGRLAVVSDWWTHDSKPIQDRLIWLTKLRADEYDHYIGRSGDYSGDLVAVHGDGYNWLRIDMGKSTPANQREVRVPPGKPRQSRRGGVLYGPYWRRGKWELYSLEPGAWIPADAVRVEPGKDPDVVIEQWDPDVVIEQWDPDKGQWVPF